MQRLRRGLARDQSGKRCEALRLETYPLGASSASSALHRILHRITPALDFGADLPQSIAYADGTVFGLLNLARTGIRVEIRMVVHRHTYARLPQFARFVVRNLPFASQVALMGLELMGYARSNLSSLWIDPVDYQDQLEEAVSVLETGGVKVLLFNHQLCLLRPPLHPYARKSISDWKNVYMPEYEPCARKVDCGGFFASAGLRYSDHIRPYQ